MDIFGLIYPAHKIKKTIRLIELFAGVGSQAMALRNLGVDFEHHRVVEFDKFAIRSYNAIHGTDFEVADITETEGEDLGVVETEKYEYILTYSFPCQDLSQAGAGAGMARGGGTRSGLLWEVERLLEETEELPQILLMENVPQVIGKKHIEHFHEWQAFLESKGYVNFTDRLNAKHYGVAQNRNRVFMVSILGGGGYSFPKPIPLEKAIVDYLEDEVEEKFYVKTERAQELIDRLIERGGLEEKQGVDASVNAPKPRETANCLLAKDRGISSQKQTGNMVLEKTPRRVGGLYDKEGKRHQAGSVWDKNQISPVLDTMGGGYREPMIVSEPIKIKQATKEGYIEMEPGGVADLSYPTSKTRRGRVQEDGTVSPTITAAETGVHRVESAYRIRKLTPLECWRLMGFTDEDFYKAQEVNSNTQLYKQAGNSIVADVLEGIFGGFFGSEFDCFHGR